MKQNKQRFTIKKHSALFRRLLLVLLGILLGAEAYFANARTVIGNQLPMPFGYGIANVLSGSMEPTFSKGTLLFVKETNEVSVGDIVVYQSGQMLIVHRVIALDGNTVTTQGDANNVADDPFDSSLIKGIVIGWIPFLGNIVSLLKTPVGVLLLLLCAVLLVEGSFRKQREQDDQELEAIKAEIRKLKEENMSVSDDKISKR